MKKVKFSNWLQQSLLFVSHGPWVWAGYTLFVGILMPLGRVSLALGILLSVTSLFVGVGVAKYIDLKYSAENPVGFYWAVNKSLPLAVLAACSIMIFWFAFMAIANLFSGELYKIGQFFFFFGANARKPEPANNARDCQLDLCLCQYHVDFYLADADHLRQLVQLSFDAV